MPRGAGAKREREYEELKGKFKKSGRYKDREEEVASRVVNKQKKEIAAFEKKHKNRKTLLHELDKAG